MGITGAIGAMGAMSLAQGYSQGTAAKAQGDYTASMYRVNRSLAGEQGKMAKAQGDIEAGQMDEEGRQELAKQRVAAASTGANVNTGSAIELQSDTKWQSKQNQITIKNNAWKQAWGYQVQGIDYGMQADLSEMAGTNAYRNSLLTGGMQAIGYGVQAGSAYRKYNG